MTLKNKVYYFFKKKKKAFGSIQRRVIMGRDLKICHKKGIDIKIFIFTKKD